MVEEGYPNYHPPYPPTLVINDKESGDDRDSGLASTYDLISSAGVLSGIDAAFVLLTRAYDEALAKQAMLLLQYNPKPHFLSGNPDLATPETLNLVKKKLEPFISKRMRIVREFYSGGGV